MGKRDVCRIIVPAVLLAMGLLLLAGCFFIPTAESPAQNSGKDFRPMLGSEPGRAIRPRYISRDAAIALLGVPAVKSDDGRSIGYFYDVQSGLWVYPLCFNAISGTQKAYALRLDFDANDNLTGYRTESAENGNSFGGIPRGSQNDALRKLNSTGSPMAFPNRWNGTDYNSTTEPTQPDTLP